MHLKNLLQNSQYKLAIYVGTAFFVAVVFSLWLVSGVSNTKALPGQPEIVHEVPPPAPPNSQNSKIILELFSPTDADVSAQLSDTSITRQIEQTLTVTYVLTKCAIISQDDYSDTYRALLLYAQLSKLAPDAAAANLKLREITESANASYALIYSKVSCTDKQLTPLAAQLTQWVTDIFSRQPAR